MPAGASPPPGLAGKLTEYGDRDFARFLRRSFAAATGYTPHALARPVVGVLNTWSELNNCHRGLRDLAEAVKRGVWQAGGLPLEFPVSAPGEIFVSPTSMFLRNLMALDVEAMLRAQPLDSVVLLGGCDKSLPALLMGAASADIPAIVLAAGPMLSGSHEGQRIGACTDCRRFWAAFRRGEIETATIQALEQQLAPTAGTCGVMGTASTMACLTETLGMMLPGGAAIPAVYAERQRHAERSGVQAVALAHSRLRPSQIMTPAAFENALRVLQALAGSTNAVIHLTAIAGRLGIRLDLDRLDALADETPVLVDLKPSGAAWMEDFHRAGAMPVLLQALRDSLHPEPLTITGATLGQQLARPFAWPAWQNVIRPLDNPLQPQGALIVLRGSLAPAGALLKRSAASPALLQTESRAIVFHSLQDLAARIDDPALDVRPDDCLILQNAGPLGAPGMPEAGYLPIPRKLTGQRDMLRISDARMSGTAFGTIVLHVAPEAAAAGPLALARSGDIVRLAADRRRLDLLVDQRELARRAEQPRPQLPPAPRGYERLYQRSVQQAHLGADFDFLRHPSLQPGD